MPSHSRLLKCIEVFVSDSTSGKYVLTSHSASKGRLEFPPTSNSISAVSLYSYLMQNSGGWVKGFSII